MLEKMISDARKLDDYIQNMHFENEVITDADFSKVEFESVQFIKCQFIKCSFSKDSFYNKPVKFFSGFFADFFRATYLHYN